MIKRLNEHEADPKAFNRCVCCVAPTPVAAFVNVWNRIAVGVRRMPNERSR